MSKRGTKRASLEEEHLIREPVVGILMGSDSDLRTMEEVSSLLDQFQIGYEMRICSAHRSPEKAAEYARGAEARGLKVLIAGAGAAAHLAGNLAAHTILPVIGIPLSSSPLQGLDALLATAQMPSGVPVATMSLDRSGARNAAILAAQILALQDPVLAGRLRENKEKMAKKVEEKDLELQLRKEKGR